MAAKTQQLPPPITHWFTAVTPVAVSKKPAIVTLAVFTQLPHAATKYHGSLSAPV